MSCLIHLKFFYDIFNFDLHNMQFRPILTIFFLKIFSYENTKLIWTKHYHIRVCIQWSYQPTNMILNNM